MSVIILAQLQLKLVSLIEKLELMSSLHETQPKIQLHLSSSEFTGALDLIAMSQDILPQYLRGIRSNIVNKKKFQLFLLIASTYVAVGLESNLYLAMVI